MQIRSAQARMSTTSFTEFLINMGSFHSFYRFKLCLKGLVVVSVFVFYFIYVLYRFTTSVYCWLFAP